MRMKRIFALLMTFVLLLGAIPADGMGSLLFPVIAQAAPEIKTGYTIDIAARTYLITGKEGWAALEKICNPNDNNNMEGWTVKLENDITLDKGKLSSVDDFRGSFDGQGHYIKIPTGESYFKDITHLGGDVGLFRNLLGSAKVENLIVWLEGGTLKAANNPENADMNSYGALVGQMANSSLLKNCALVGGGTIEYGRKIPLTSYVESLDIGSMVGQMKDGAKIEGCYSELSVTAIRTADSVPSTASKRETTMLVGGIVGGLATEGCILLDLAYLGPKVEAQNYADGGMVAVGGIMGLGGTFGIANSITNCFVKGTHLYGKDTSDGSLRIGYYGQIGPATATKMTNCYSNAEIHSGGSSLFFNTGRYDNIGGVNAAMMGSAWADTMEGFPSLKWLVTPKNPLEKVTVTADNANAMTITPPYINYSGGTGGYDATNGDSLWKFDMEIPIKGRTAPMINSIDLHKTSGSAIVNKVVVGDNSGANGEYYSGLEYPFLATIEGSNVVGNLSPAKLTWAAVAKHSTGVVVDPSGWWKAGEKGTLAIPADFYGTIDVTATYDGVVSTALSLTVKRGTLTLANQTVPPSTNVPMALTLNAAQGVLNAVQPAHVAWTLTKGDANFKLDKSGVLGVGASSVAEATVTAEVVGMDKANATITVSSTASPPTPGTAATLTKTQKDSPTKTNPLGMQGVDNGGGGSTTAYSVTLPTGAGMSYYYKFANDTDAVKELATVYTSTAMLAEAPNSYMEYTAGIKLQVSGNAFVEANIMVVAVDNDVGNKLPSAVTKFVLPPVPTEPESKIACGNTGAAGALASAKGKLTGGFYSTDGTNTAQPGSPKWNDILPSVKTPNNIHPSTVEHIATGDIKVTVYPAKDRFGQDIDIARGSRFVASASGSGTKGEVAPKPTIYPRGNGIITGGVTISIPDGAKVFYTKASNVIAPVRPEVNADGTSANDKTTMLYTAGTVIDFPPMAKSFVVCAVAWIDGKSLSDIDYVVYKNTENLLTPAAPTLLLGGIKYSVDSTYPADSQLVFDHPELADGEVLFTVNGEEPVAGRNNTKIFLSSGATGPNSFDPTKPYPMNSTSEFVSVRAKFHDKKKDLYSSIADYLVSVKQNLSAPVASVANNTMVRPNASLELSLSDAAIAQLNTNSKVPVKRLKYSPAIDDKATAFPGVLSVTINGTPQEGADYVSYQVDSNSQAYNLPVIRYRLGDDKTDLAGSGTIYQYGQRRVLSISKTIKDPVTGTDKIETTVTITYTNPQPIALTGAVGQKIKVNAMAVSGMDVRADSTVATFSYTIRSAMEKPTAFPKTEPTKPTPINIGDRIALSSATSDALIFYTLDGSEPKVEYTPPTAPSTVGSWTPLDVNTKLYNDTQSIKMESNAQLLFTIRAIAVSKDFSLENSPEALFLYQPPASVPAVFASPIQGAVVVNQAITLRCATEDARIFYKTFTSAPDITSAQGKLDNIPQPNRDQIFDPKVPITITKPTWIVAVAEKNGAMSTPTVNAYTIAPTLTEPTSSLKTGSVVHKGTRIHLTSTGSIAYTLDGSDPKAGMAALQAVPPPAAKDTPAVLFGDSLVIDGEYGKSVIVKAFTYGEGHTPSNVATFTYTICDKDTYITAVPAKGAVITNGSTITLTTTLSDGLMFYSTGSNTPTIINRYDDDGWYNWDAEDKKHESYDTYQWRAGTGTRRSNSVRVNGASGSTFTVKAIAVANGSEGGSTQVFTYTIRERTAAPSASVPNGAVALEGAKVTLSAQEGDIFYTVDGSEPTTSSRLYVEPIPITGSMVLKTIALAKDKTASDVAEYIYSYADQAFAPSMSIPGGEIEQGSRITLTSPTEGASIYYSTNGADPTDKSTLYTSPIAVMRPVTIKAIAIKKELRSSAVNSASYTVVEPQRPDIDEGGGNDKPKTQLDSLVSRRTYFDETAGPKFSDVIIRDTTTNTILSANGTAVPAGAELVVKQVDSSDSDREAVRTALNYHIVSLYDVSLERNGEVVEPEGQVEIGIPIPADYQNGMVAICRVGTDNTVEEYEPRRSGNNAYITVEGKLDRYAVVVPEVNKELSTQLSVWQIFLISVLTAVGAGGVTLGVIRFIQKRRRAAAQNAYTDAPDHFND